VDALERDGLDVQDARSLEPSLEDVFIHLLDDGSEKHAA
jgi:hypothetical protein